VVEVYLQGGIKMTRIFGLILVVVLWLLASAISGWSAGPMLLQGQVRNIQGRPAAGAEIKLTDRTGILRYHINGTVSFPGPSAGNAAALFLCS
jgi:hypothetical protein